MADIVFKYAEGPLTSTSSATATRRMLGASASVNDKVKPHKPTPKNPPLEVMISHIDESHIMLMKKKGSSDEGRKGKLGDSTLDLKNGIISGVFVEKNTKDIKEVKITAREYFALP